MTRWLTSLLSVTVVSVAGTGFIGPSETSTSEPPPVRLPAAVVPPPEVRYALPVVELREPPARMLELWEAAEASPQLEETVRPFPTTGQCPVELRAVIAAAEGDGFAMVSVGGESLVARVGDRLQTALGRVKVHSLSQTQMVLTGSFGKRRCTLDVER